MRTRSLRTLRRIAEIGSFTQAAAAENMTLSALSAQMSNLERDLGAALFDRSVRPPALTPLGRRVADMGGAILRDEARLRALCDPDAPLAGRFAVGFISSASVRMLPGFLTRMEADAPGVEVVLRSDLSERLVAQVASGVLDAAVVTGTDAANPGLVEDVVAREAMRVITPGGTMANASPGRPFFHFKPESGIGRVIAGILAERGLRPARTVVLENVEAAVECVRQGLGWSILPGPDIERYRAADLIVPGLVDMSRDLVLVTRADAFDSLRATFLRALGNGA
ncbi:LysR family transcriptional regulator [Jannaschia sp. LMIT008]|uniref:LysR family transcriptional regulator n=1 Tax=Jannaschia maritima TaxID=3032585 RepID=UPI002811A92D|nr:LysR family transcriptional regulator [Jannaschia sp. LMIT008]